MCKCVYFCGQPGFWGLGNSLFRCSPCDCDIGGAQSTQYVFNSSTFQKAFLLIFTIGTVTECLSASLRCSPEEGQCRCLPNMVGRRCSDPAPGYFLPSLDYFLYEAELAAPLLGGASSTTNPPSSPLVCNQLGYYHYCPSSRPWLSWRGRLDVWGFSLPSRRVLRVGTRTLASPVHAETFLGEFT